MSDTNTKGAEQYRDKGWAWTIESIIQADVDADPRRLKWVAFVGKAIGENKPADYQEFEVRGETLEGVLEEILEQLGEFEKFGRLPLLG